MQSLVQNSRKAGITSALTSSTLHNEELVCIHAKYQSFSLHAQRLFILLTMLFLLYIFCRRVMSIRRHFRPSYIPSPAPPHTILRCGQPPPPLTATSVRGCCGALLARACAVPSVGSNATRSAKIYSMLIVCKVRWALLQLANTYVVVCYLSISIYLVYRKVS